MERPRNRKHRKRRNCDNCCPFDAINDLKAQSYSDGFIDGYNKAVDRMLAVVGVVFTVIGSTAAVITLVGALLRVLITKCTYKSKHLIGCSMNSRSSFYHSF